MLTDGHHRLQAAKELGVTRIPVEINRAYAKYDAGRYPEGFAKQVGKPGQEIKYLSELLEPDVQFARASAGAFDFGMREVQNGKLIRPGKPPLGTKDGWMTELEFRVNGGEFGPLQKDEVAFYKQLVPEAFANDKVHLQKLWDGLGKVGEQVKVVTYGQDVTSDARARYDELHHIWWDNLSTEDRYTFNAVMDHFAGPLEGAKRQEAINQLQAHGMSPSNIEMALEFHDADVQSAKDFYSGPRATSHYDQISPFDKKKFPIIKISVVLPKRVSKVREAEILKEFPTAGKTIVERESNDLPNLWTPDDIHEDLPNTLGWAMVQIVPDPKTGESVMFVGEARDDTGLVTIVITDTEGNPGSSELCTKVYNYIMRPDMPQLRLAPVNSLLSVIAPSTVVINVSCTVYLEEGYLMETVRLAFIEKLKGFLINTTESVRYLNIAALLSPLYTQGIEDATNITLNGGTVNIPLTQGQIATVGTVTFNAP